MPSFLQGKKRAGEGDDDGSDEVERLEILQLLDDLMVCALACHSVTGGAETFNCIPLLCLCLLTQETDEGSDTEDGTDAGDANGVVGDTEEMEPYGNRERGPGVEDREDGGQVVGAASSAAPSCMSTRDALGMYDYVFGPMLIDAIMTSGVISFLEDSNMAFTFFAPTSQASAQPTETVCMAKVCVARPFAVNGGDVPIVISMDRLTCALWRVDLQLERPLQDLLRIPAQGAV